MTTSCSGPVSSEPRSAAATPTPTSETSAMPTMATAGWHMMSVVGGVGKNVVVAGG
jgi:hypothetical protein